MDILDRKPVASTSKYSESNSVLWSSNSDIMAETNLNKFQNMCYLLFKLSCLNIIHQVFQVFTAEQVCLRAGMTVSLCVQSINNL